MRQQIELNVCEPHGVEMATLPLAKTNWITVQQECAVW